MSLLCENVKIVYESEIRDLLEYLHKFLADGEVTKARQKGMAEEIRSILDVEDLYCDYKPMDV